MSKLDSFIRRMSAQRDILNDIATRLDVDGPIFEFGFGRGRSYDHLKERFPGRRIVVFESVDWVSAHIDPAVLIFGDIRQTTSTMADASAALVHADIETGDAARDMELQTWLPGLVARLLVPGGFAASGAALPDPRLVDYPLPPGIAAGRYHAVRRL